MTRYFHEKTGPCQAVFSWVVLFVQPTADQREAQLAFSLFFLEWFSNQVPLLPTDGHNLL